MTAVRDRGGYPALTAKECEKGETSRGRIVCERTVLGRRRDVGYGVYCLEEVLHRRGLQVELYG